MYIAATVLVTNNKKKLYLTTQTQSIQNMLLHKEVTSGNKSGSGVYGLTEWTQATAAWRLLNENRQFYLGLPKVQAQGDNFGLESLSMEWYQCPQGDKNKSLEVYWSLKLTTDHYGNAILIDW